MKPLLGGKGANLAEMCRIGLPVPPGFTITTEVCTYYYDNKRTYPPALKRQMEAGIAALEQQTGKKFGDLKDPLLVSVRSGARDSMPGMMDTILNLGLNDQTVEALSTKTGNARFAWDCYRRFVQMYGDVVLGVQKRPDEDHEPFETVIHELKHERYHQRHRGHQAHGRRPEGARRPVQGARQGAHRQAVSRFALGPADGRRRRGVRFVDERPRDRLSPQVQHPDRMGHGRQRAGDGVRQHRRQLRVGRRVHAQPGQRREGVLRRVPDQRAGRRRRRRRPHARAGGRAQEGDAEGVRRARTDPPDAREALQGRAGLRVHDRRRRRLHAPDAQRQAHRDGGAEVLDGHAEGEAHRLEDGGDAQPRRSARAVAGAGVRRRPRSPRPRSSPRAFPPVPARRPARSISTPSAPWRRPTRARRCCSSASRRRPKTSAA